MNEQFNLLNQEALIFLWVPVAAATAGIVGIISSKKIITSVFPGYERENPGELGRKIVMLSVILLSMVLTVFAFARPSFGNAETTVSKKGRDVVFVVDVSRSMLAEDLYPNRLDRAKLAITDTLSVIDGDRVGLVAFAGTAVVKCPLTMDYNFFRQAVEELSPDAVSLGGSMIGDALRKTLDEVLSDGGGGGFRDVILITDGEDQESYPEEAAGMLGEKKIRLIAIGLGDEDTGKRIPVTNDAGEKVYLTYDGREIWSRLDASMLRLMAAKTPGGRYLNVSTGTFDMAEIYSALIKSQQKRFIEDQTSIEYQEDFQYFLAPAVILLIVYLFGHYCRLSNRSKNLRRRRK